MVIRPRRFAVLAVVAVDAKIVRFSAELVIKHYIKQVTVNTVNDARLL